MPELLRIPDTITAETAAPNRIRRWTALGAKLIFWSLALLTLVAFALQLGAKQREFAIAGPFAAETNPAQHSLILPVPRQDRAAWWRQPLVADNNEKPFESILELQINGRQMDHPHSSHDVIRKRKIGAFSHWGPNVIFSLPPEVRNDSQTTATLRYNVRPRTWITFALAGLTGILGWLLYGPSLQTIARRYGERPIAIALATPYLVLLGLFAVALMSSTAYLLASLHALATGWALPTTAPISWSPMAQWAVHNERHLGYLLLTVAGIGASVTWLAGSKHHQSSVTSYEHSVRRVLAWCGFPIVASAFIFCISTMWAGFLKPGHPSSANIGGLIPFSDAANYLTAAFDQAKDGVWSAPALYRPMAAAFRSVLLFFGNYSLQLMLVVQACLVAAAACFAAHAVTMWRGIWAGIAFLALIYIYFRYFVPTTLTEPLGLFWALLSIPFFVEAIRYRSVRPALVAFAMTVMALMIRMGSMFTIPALMLWLVWQFGNSRAAKLKIFAVSLSILLGVVALNSLLRYAYTAGSTSSNFAYVFCGLTIGTSWDGCLPKLASEGKTLRGGQAAFVEALYSMAWDNLRAKPEVFFGRLADGAGEFIRKLAELNWRGYGFAIEQPDWLFRNLLTSVVLAGLLYIAIRRAKAIELTFWLLLWVSLVASASVVYFDDGMRAMAASQPLIALFFAMGLTSPILTSAEPTPRPRLLQCGTLALLTAAALFVSVPWIAHRFSPVETMLRNAPALKQGEALVFGGRRMSGFLVVEDGSELREDVPTLHLADFKALIGQSGVERYQQLIHPVMPPLPFGFVFAPRIEKGALSNRQFIVPAEVLTRRDVEAWRFQLKRWGDVLPHSRGNEYWLYVTKAEPLH